MANTYRSILAHGCLSDLDKAILSKCENPIKLVQPNKFTGVQEIHEVPCGTCWHCRTQHQNEWVARMQMHSLVSPNGKAYKHIYFVTLTYKDLTFEDFTTNSVYANFMRHTFPLLKHKDSNDLSSPAAFAPMLIDRSHIAIFMRKLRTTLEKRDGVRHADLSFFACAEYGHENGRPHLHFILFDNLPINVFYIRQAWSFYLGNTKDNQPMWSPIGHVDFHDLYANGCMCHVGYNGGVSNGNKATNAFAYVAKYCTKREFNKSGVKRVWNEIRDSFYAINNLTKDPTCTLPNRASAAPSLLTIEKNNLVKQIVNKYENYQNQHSTTFESENLSYFYYQEFERLYTPFTRASSSLSIGKFYALSNIERFAQGNFTLHKDLNGNVPTSFPHYFIRKTNEYVNGLRQISSSTSRCYVRLLPRLLDEIGLALDEMADPTSVSHHINTSSLIPFDEVSYEINGNADEFVRRAKKHYNLLTDRFYSSYFALSPDLQHIVVIEYHNRHYVVVDTILFEDWLAEYHA